MLEFHRERQADCTVACMEVSLAEGRQFGIMATNTKHHVIDFQEKPREPRPLSDDPTRTLASMGIYVFSLPLLCELLNRDHDDGLSAHDFGKDILPNLIHSHSVAAYRFGGERGRVSCDRYWRDVGTIDAYLQASMDLLKPVAAHQPRSAQLADSHL